VAETEATTAVAAPVKPPAEYAGYTRLTDAERISILSMHDKGITQNAIAELLSRSVATVHDVIHTFTPSVDLAKRKLRASALKMAENIVDNGLPRDHVQALKGLGVLEETQQQGFTVNIGIADSVVQVQVLTPLVKVTE
jgi:hypothetical protein